MENDLQYQVHLVNTSLYKFATEERRNLRPCSEEDWKTVINCDNNVALVAKLVEFIPS